jgi:hypothetical protein
MCVNDEMVAMKRIGCRAKDQLKLYQTRNLHLQVYSIFAGTAGIDMFGWAEIGLLTSLTRSGNDCQLCFYGSNIHRLCHPAGSDSYLSPPDC